MLVAVKWLMVLQDKVRETKRHQCGLTREAEQTSGKKARKRRRSTTSSTRLFTQPPKRVRITTTQTRTSMLKTAAAKRPTGD